MNTEIIALLSFDASTGKRGRPGVEQTPSMINEESECFERIDETS